MLTEKLTGQVANKKQEIKQEHFQKFKEEKKTASMVQACELAGSILNMSKQDIDELLDVDIFEVLLFFSLDIMGSLFLCIKYSGIDSLHQRCNRIRRFKANKISENRVKVGLHLLGSESTL